MESSSRTGVPARLLRSNVLLGHSRLGEPVHTVLVPLRREANAADLTGVYTRAGADGVPYLEVRYTVIRLWEESMAGLLAGGPTLATEESKADLPDAVARFAERLRRPDVPGNVRNELAGYGLVLAGLVHPPGAVAPLMQRMSMTFEGTPGYEWIKQQGKAEEARRLVHRLAERRFGVQPNSGSALGGITDIDRLERMALRVHAAAGWDDLLATP